MPNVELPQGLVGSENLPRTHRNLINCFNNGNGDILSTPGRELIRTVSGIARAQFEWNGSLYEVRSTNLVKITNLTTGAFTTIGTISGTAIVKVAIGFNTATLVVSAATGSLYTLDSSDNLVDISGNANIVPCRDIAHINGRFVYIPFNGDPAFFSDVGAAGTVQGTSFFDAEELPDKNKFVFNGKNTLYICGENSIELFRDTGASPNPFIRINGARILNGVIGGLLEYNNTFLFVGREKDQDAGIYSIVQGGAAKISNETIDEKLSSIDFNQLEEAESARFKWRGYDIATFKVGSESFGFFGGNWFTLNSLTVNNTVVPYEVGFVTQFKNVYYTASSTNFGKLTNINTDYGLAIERIIDTAFEDDTDDNFKCQSIDLNISQGYNAIAQTVGLAMSRDNVTYSQYLFRSLGAIGQYDQKLIWNPAGGLGTYNGFMAVRIYTRDNVKFSISGMTAKFR